MSFTESDQFQTPYIVCKYMVSLIGFGHILEPTPGLGNLRAACQKAGVVTSPEGDFWDFYTQARAENWRFDYVVMNPPFSPMLEGYSFLTACMELSDSVVALMPWLVLINSEKRMTNLRDWGLVSVTHLPRKAFPGSKVQTCVIQLRKNYTGKTELKHFTW